MAGGMDRRLSSPMDRRLSISCNVLLEDSAYETNYDSQYDTSGEPSQRPASATRQNPRSRQQSPHPADVIKGQVEATAAARAAAAAELQRSQMKMSGLAPVDNLDTSIYTQHSSPTHTLEGSSTTATDDSIPNFALTNLGNDTETAEQLHHLITAMQTEFRRLRSSKMRSEAKVNQLSTELSIQQQEMEKHFESLSMENERLKASGNESTINLGRLGAKVSQLENENRVLKSEMNKLQHGKEIAEAKAVAAELRAESAQKEMRKMSKAMRRSLSGSRGSKDSSCSSGRRESLTSISDLEE